MIIQNPWAWLGILAIALPVAAHLLARRPAHRQLFPHLRFLPAAALKPVRRDRLADIALLAVRGAIVATATMALAQPLLVTDARARDLGSRIARAVVVDTSASMSGGRDAARREAAAAAAAATVARVGETPAPAGLLAASVAWLATQPMRREIVVVSDFQVTALTQADLAAVPAEVGLRMVQIDLGSRFREIDPGSHFPGAAGKMTPGVDFPKTTPGVDLLAGAAERAGAEAARSAAGERGGLARPVAIVFPGFESRAALLAAARPIDEPWMFDVLMRVGEDPVFRAAAARAGRTASDVVTALGASVDGTKHLLLVTTAPAGSLMSAALIGAASRAVDATTPAAELTHEVRTSDELRSWERPPAAVAPTGAPPLPDQSDGRWWWVGALALLLLETVMRRSRPAEAAPEASHARVA